MAENKMAEILVKQAYEKGYNQAVEDAANLAKEPNKMKLVAALFGRELGDEFRVKRNYYLSCNTVKARFIDEGFQILWDGNDYWTYHPESLVALLTGRAAIVDD